VFHLVVTGMDRPHFMSTMSILSVFRSSSLGSSGVKKTVSAPVDNGLFHKSTCHYSKVGRLLVMNIQLMQILASL